MLKFLVGPILVGAGYAAGSYYGADAEQIVHKRPAQTYVAVEQALSNFPTSGTTSFDGGQPSPYEIKIDRTPGEKLAATLFFAGRRAAEVDIAFSAQNSGRDTLMKANVHGDGTVLRAALAGTDKAEFAYAPDWMLNLTFKPLLHELAVQIEEGRSGRFPPVNQADSGAEWEANLRAEQRDDVARWREDEATQPAVDPDAAAQSYMGRSRN